MKADIVEQGIDLSSGRTHHVTSEAWLRDRQYASFPLLVKFSVAWRTHCFVS